MPTKKNNPATYGLNPLLIGALPKSGWTYDAVADWRLNPLLIGALPKLMLTAALTRIDESQSPSDRGSS